MTRRITEGAKCEAAVAFYHRELRPKHVPVLGVAYLAPVLPYLSMRGQALGKFAFQPAVEFNSNPLVYAPRSTALWTALKLPLLYLWKTVFPVNLSASYHYNQIPLVETPLHWQVLAGIALLGLFVCLAVH